MPFPRALPSAAAVAAGIVALGLAAPTAGAAPHGRPALSGSQLQAQLNAAAPGTTVSLAVAQVVQLSGQSLVVPAGVTLATASSPGYDETTKLAKLSVTGAVCQGNRCDHTAAVVLRAGAKLRNIWVEGPGATTTQGGLALVGTDNSRGSSGTTITQTRLTGVTPGGTGVRLEGWGTTGVACSGVSVTANRIVDDASSFRLGGLGEDLTADGIDVQCESATVQTNLLTGTTGRGITIHGQRYRVPTPHTAPAVAASAGGSFAAGSYTVQLAYTLTGGQRGDAGPGAAVTLAAGQKITVGALTGLPTSVASVTVSVSDASGAHEGPTVAVTNGGTAAIDVTAMPTGAAPAVPRWDQRHVGATQRSQVVNNVVTVDRSAVAAYAVDPLGECLPAYGPADTPIACLDAPDQKIADWVQQNDYRDFTGSLLSGNSYAATSGATVTAGVLLGSRAVWGENGPAGRGATVRNTARFLGGNVGVQSAFVVSGMYDVTLTGNDVAPSGYTVRTAAPTVTLHPCPVALFAANSTDATFTAGSQAPAATTARWNGCLALPPAAAMERVRVAADHRTFAGSSGRRFSPYGQNYATLNGGILTPSRDQVIDDLRRLRRDGSNVARIFLEFSDIVDAPSAGHPDGTPNAANLARVADVADIAAQIGIYLDVTGLLQSDEAHSPAWYDALTANGGEVHGRWQAQATFWSAVAGALAGKTSVLDYNLMNEPFAPNNPQTKDKTVAAWLGDKLGTVAYVQPITLNQNGRTATDIAKAWIGVLVPAIRAQDSQTMVTVGMLPFGTNGAKCIDCTSFDPRIIGPQTALDYLSVHEYPDAGQQGIEDALVDAGAYQVGKPVVIEETMSLPNADGEQMTSFLLRSASFATGWYGQVTTPYCTTFQLSNPPGSCGGDTWGIYQRWNQIFLSALPTLRRPCGPLVP